MKGPHYTTVTSTNSLGLDASLLGMNSEVIVAFETELATVGYKGRTHAKTWREEFEKLCGLRRKPQLRVLSSYFLRGQGSSFQTILQYHLNELKTCFEKSGEGNWLFVFGPEDSRKDRDQPWLAFTFDAQGSLILLPFGDPHSAHGISLLE